MNTKKVLQHTHRELTASPVVPAVVVFLTIIALVGSAWRTAQHDTTNTRDNLVEERAVLSETNVLQQVYSYENALLSARGFILSSDDVSRTEWQSFISSMRLDERRRGMLGIGYTDLVQP